MPGLYDLAASRYQPHPYGMPSPGVLAGEEDPSMVEEPLDEEASLGALADEQMAPPEGVEPPAGMEEETEPGGVAEGSIAPAADAQREAAGRLQPPPAPPPSDRPEIGRMTTDPAAMAGAEHDIRQMDAGASIANSGGKLAKMIAMSSAGGAAEAGPVVAAGGEGDGSNTMSMLRGGSGAIAGGLGAVGDIRNQEREAAMARLMGGGMQQSSRVPWFMGAGG